MIVRENKGFETHIKFPNVDWYNEGSYVIDETKEENQELIQKIKEHAPYMELVVESDEVVDIIPTEKPEPEPGPPPEPSETEKLQAENAELWFSIMENDTRDTSQDTDIADIWFEIMNSN